MTGDVGIWSLGAISNGVKFSSVSPAEFMELFELVGNPEEAASLLGEAITAIKEKPSSLYF